ncbi:MAG: SoxR reducing system RseC family protein [Candidatus Marinimicrobia bacterium]|nr:SoxR reducing system RseC family protein [Candidatus Neomarinimicrobiota bacterium]
MGQRNPAEDGYEIGKVKKVMGQFAEVEIEKIVGCEHCNVKTICGVKRSGKCKIRLLNVLNAEPGDRVLLKESDIKQIKLVTIEYGLPLLGFLIGLTISFSLIKDFPFSVSSELGSFIIGILTLLGSGYFANRWSKRKLSENFSILEMKSILQD